MEAEVVVVGAGPVGLLLAAELALAGVRPIVLERLAEPSDQPKARGIGPLAAEALRRRGLGAELDREHEHGLRKLERDLGTTRFHFAWIHKIDPIAADPGRRGALIGQPALEALLRRHLQDLGVEVLFGHTVTGLETAAGVGLDHPLGVGPDLRPSVAPALRLGAGPALRSGAPGEPGIGDGVSGSVLTVDTPTGPRRIAAGYVVGCDGGRSAVRKLAGFDFPGTPPLMTVRFARAGVVGSLPAPGRLANGTLFHGDGLVATYDFLDTEPDRSAPLTAEEMRASVHRVTGVDVEITEFQGGMRFTDQARQVDSYRRGRTLLAGDAAHVHSPNGGQGLNLGLMDAMNLGWKLAAAVHGNGTLPDPHGALPHTYDTLLDSYDAERRPVGAAVLANTRAQSALLVPGPHVDALRDVFSDLMDLPEVNRHLSRLLSGVTIRHEMPYPATHPLTGMACPPLTVDGVPLEELTTDGHALLLHPDAEGIQTLLRPDAEGIQALPRPDAEGIASGRVKAVTAKDLGDDRLAAVLLRPDGVIAWAAAPGDDLRRAPGGDSQAAPGDDSQAAPGGDSHLEGLRRALDTWFRGARQSTAHAAA
jgi:2-polyprenyl-6-methoxyphenol hydroxylase-like FAD-dependent oxidoreductase